MGWYSDGATVWLLGIDDQSNLYRLPSTIHDGKRTKFVDQVLKVAEIMLRLDNRKPSKVMRVIYYKLKFDENGILDKDYSEEQLRLQFESLSFPGDTLTQSQVIAKEKYRAKYTWQPTTKELTVMNRYLGGKGLPLNELIK